MASRVRWKSHARFRAGEKTEIISNSYLSLFIIFDICFAATSDAVIPKAYEGGIKSETAKLLNVAMTRAETFFILIGDTDGIKNMNESFLLKDWIMEIEKLGKKWCQNQLI